MDYSEVSFISYNSTGLDPVKIKWINDLLETFNVEFLQIQEHFKTNKLLDNYFQHRFPRFDSYVLPGHREPFQDTGRSKGGLAQLISQNSDLKAEKVSTKSWRIQTQIITIRKYRLIWINCYFPTDPQTVVFNSEELLEVLDEIEYLLDNNDFDDCVLGGDLNFDCRRNSGFVMMVKDFMDRIGLKSVWNKFNVDFTHLHTDLKSTSVLDHFFVNQRLFDHVIDASPIHLGDNPSRHSPIMIKINVPKVYSRAPTQEGIRVQKPTWYKATPEDILQYKLKLEQKIQSIHIPEGLNCIDVTCKDKCHSKDIDKVTIDILCALVETCYENLPLTGRISTQGFLRKKSMPGWTDFIPTFKKDSLFWHSIWVSAGRPSSGQLHKIMCHTRAKYHSAIKSLKKVNEAKKAQSLEIAAEVWDIALINELKRSLGGPKHRQLIPSSFEGKTEPDDVLEKFKECYEDLYNSVNTVDSMKVIKNLIEQNIDPSSVNEVSKISGLVVKQASSRMKPGKVDVSDVYTSDALINAPDSFFEILALLFRSFLTHGTVTLQLLSCAFLPLYKGGLKNAEKIRFLQGHCWCLPDLEAL